MWSYRLFSLAPFIPSKSNIVKRMLEIAEVNRDDVVFDLGCGDGRILISAVKDFGAKKAIGYELRTDLYEKNLQQIKKTNLEGRVEVVRADMIKADIKEATVITLYLTFPGNRKLEPKLSEEAQPGTRIVSHAFEIEGWDHSEKESFDGHLIYLYKIPEALKKKAEKKSFFKRLTFFR